MTGKQLTISTVNVGQDKNGLYCLNDLHKASGGKSKYQPHNWLRLQQTEELIEEINRSSDVRNAINVVQGGNNQGTYVCKELVFAYAMWISPKFHLVVIRAYDAMVSVPQNAIPQTFSEALRLAADLEEQKQVLQSRIDVAEPKAAALHRIAVSEGTMNLRETAKHLQIRISVFTKYLNKKWIFKSSDNKPWEAYQEALERGWLIHKIATVHREGRPDRTCTQVLVTSKGLARLSLLKEKGAF